MTRPLRVFLCHASQDKPAVRELYGRLKTEDWIDPWLDEEKLSLGQHWTTVIEDALENADVVIIFLSHNSVQKEGFIQRELNYAWEISLEKPREAIFLIPFRLDDCQIPRYLSARQWGDYFGEKKENTYQVLLRSLKQRHLQKLQLEALESAEREKTEKEAKLKAERIANAKAKLVAEQKAQQESFESTEKIAREELKRETTEKRQHELREKQELKEKKNTFSLPRTSFVARFFIIGGIALVGLLCFIFGANYLIQNFSTNPIPTSQPTPTSQFDTLNLDIGSTIIGEDGMTLVFVPAGEFTMGSETGFDDEKPQHQVYLDAYWIDQTEVTNGMYEKCVQANQCDSPADISSHTRKNYFGNSEFDNYPVMYVSWNDAIAYCEYVNRRLPTEAEWEKAARGTDGNIYPWGNVDPKANLLNFNGNQGDTTEVGSYPAGESIYGALDMAGNVWEWVNDWYDDKYYSSSPSSNPPGPTSGDYKVLHGGMWNDDGYDVRSSYRNGYDLAFSDYSLGFRCSRSP
jgi:formylglycine-generating enzyme required for sulfatase activity